MIEKCHQPVLDMSKSSNFAVWSFLLGFTPEEDALEATLKFLNLPFLFTILQQPSSVTTKVQEFEQSDFVSPLYEMIEFMFFPQL